MVYTKKALIPSCYTKRSPKTLNQPRSSTVTAPELPQADGIVIVHPNWWGQPPAILKGWVDRVFRSGVAYEFAELEDVQEIVQRCFPVND